MLSFAIRALLSNRIKRAEPARVARLAEDRLRHLVRFVIARSPHYRDAYRHVDPDRFELRDLPVTDKAKLMADFDRVVTDPAIRRDDLERFVDDPGNEGRPFRGRYVVSHTSGSQGQPMLIVQDRRHLELFFSLQMTRGRVGRVDPIEAARKFVRPARLAIVTLKRGFYPSAATFESIPRSARAFMRLLWLSHTDDDVVERLNAYRPTALTGYASVLEELALEADAGRLRLAPELEQVVSNSEVLSERAAERIGAAFGLHVLNNYACGECVHLSNGCPTDPGAHVNADRAILEVVDDRYEPVPAGTPGSRVLVTNLVNRTLPFIRYEIGDVVTMADDACRCGSRLPRIARIEGRAADTLWVADGGRYRQMTSSVFKNAFDHTREVREWQAEQVERNRFRVRVELLPGAALDEPHLWWSLNRQLDLYRFGGLVAVDLEVVPRLAPDPKTGKYRRIISRVGEPRDLSSRRRVDPPHGRAAPPAFAEQPSRAGIVGGRLGEGGAPLDPPRSP